jgi:acetoin utilization protein AcuB
MKVRERMNREVATVSPQDPLEQALALMGILGIRHLPVVDGARLVGLLPAPARGPRERRRSRRSAERRVLHVMSIRVRTIGPDASLREASARMVETGIDCLPVVQGSKLVGILTAMDLDDRAPETATHRRALVREFLRDLE